MFSQHVAEPVLRLASLWNDFQQVGIDAAARRHSQHARGERFVAGLALEAERKDQHQRRLFPLRPGHAGRPAQCRPGNRAGRDRGTGGPLRLGKEHTDELVQRLQIPRLGRVLVDDVDLSTVDSATLRRQIGVVLQENILFSRSIRENIALADPVASMDRIIRAVKLAGAHEFISELPGGYDNDGGRTRIDLVRRTAPAHRDRARASDRAADLDLRRSHQRARL